MSSMSSKKKLKPYNITQPGEPGHLGSKRYYMSLLNNKPQSALALEWLNRAKLKDPEIANFLKQRKKKK